MSGSVQLDPAVWPIHNHEETTTGLQLDPWSPMWIDTRRSMMVAASEATDAQETVGSEVTVEIALEERILIVTGQATKFRCSQ